MTPKLDFEVTQWLLAREELKDGDGTPSSASGISGEAWKTGSVADWDAGIVWLLEPRRSSIVQKWSGTMVHPNRSDKLHMTMSAFAHFSLLWSQYTLVFADIQSKCYISKYLLLSLNSSPLHRLIRGEGRSESGWENPFRHHDPHSFWVSSYLHLLLTFF